MNTWTLRLLGPFSLRANEKPVRLGRKAEALLTYVGVQGTAGARRSELMELLWTGHDDVSARNALRQCIHQIRREAGSVAGEKILEIDGDLLRLSAQDCDVDLWRFETLVSRRDRDALNEAAPLAAGLLAQGLNATPAFDHWLAIERQRLRGASHQVLARFAEVAATQIECDAALRLADVLLAEDPLHEGCYRALMTLYDRAGLRGKALQVWDECRRELRAELGVEPSSQTLALYERLRGPLGSGAIRPSANDGAQSLVALTRTPASTGPLDVARHSRAYDHMLRALQFYYLGTAADNAQARDAYAAALAEAPDNAEAACFLAWTHYTDFMFGWNGDPDASFGEARRKADAALIKYPGHHAVYALDGKLLLWQEQYESAVEQMEAALAIQPAAPYIYSNLADAQMRSGNYAEALRLTARSLELEPNERGVVLTIVGLTRFCMGQLDLALTSFESAVTRNPRYCVAHSAMAAALVELGDLRKARESAAKSRVDNRRMSVDYARYVLPMRDQAQRKRFVESWRAAGMPEHETPVSDQRCASRTAGGTPESQ